MSPARTIPESAGVGGCQFAAVRMWGPQGMYTGKHAVPSWVFPKHSQEETDQCREWWQPWRPQVGCPVCLCVSEIPKSRDRHSAWIPSHWWTCATPCRPHLTRHIAPSCLARKVRKWDCGRRRCKLRRQNETNGAAPSWAIVIAISQHCCPVNISWLQPPSFSTLLHGEFRFSRKVFVLITPCNSYSVEISWAFPFKSTCVRTLFTCQLPVVIIARFEFSLSVSTGHYIVHLAVNTF